MAAESAAAAEAAFTTAYRTMAGDSVRRDPQSRLRRARRPARGRAARAPVVHTVHLPPDQAVSAALRQVTRSSRPPTVAVVSDFQASAWRRVVPVDAVLPPYPPTRAIGWSESGRGGRAVRGPAEPGEGRGGGHRHRPRGGSADRGLRRRLRCRIQPGADRPAARLAGRDRAPGSTPDRAVGGHGPRGRGVVPVPVGRTLRAGRRRGAGVRDSRRGVPARRTR